MLIKRLGHCLLLTAVCLVMVPMAQAAGTAPSFFDGIRKYEQSDWDGAIAAFDRIADTGVQNGQLFYNLGNAYLKKGDIGRAVMWYLRARKQIPDDPDLTFNLGYALSLVKDKTDDQGPSIFPILFFWRQMFSRSALQWTAVLLNLVFWLVLSYRRVRRKKILNTVNALILSTAVVFILTAAYNHYEDRYAKTAIVLPERVSVRSGLSENATELFVLHAGSRVRVEKENGAFVRILFSKGKIGWIPKEEVGII
jgi:tetratricopeptide (TPR) repeat protein